MSATEKLFVKIFERKKQIVEQVRHESLLWEHNLLPLLIFNGIPPPPWLSNSALHSSFPSDPKDLFKDDTVYQGQPSPTQSGVPSVGDHCSLYNNLNVHAFNKDHDTGGRLSNLPECSVSNAGCASSVPPELDSGTVSPQNQIEPRSRQKALDHDTGGRLSNFPDCSFNNVECASSGPPELNSVAISPQNQIEQRVSESFLDPAESLSKLHRSRSRQKALEQRNSAKASKPLLGDGDNTGDCTAAATRSAPPSLQEDHIKELSLVNEFHPNNRSCLTEEMRRGGRLTQKDHNFNYTGRITRFKSSSQKFNSLSIGSSSEEKENGPPLNDLNEEMELINRPSVINGSCGVQDPNIIDFQNKDIGSSVYDKRFSKPRSSSQAEQSTESLNLDSTSGRHKAVEVSDLNQPCSESAGKKSQNVQPTKLETRRLSSSPKNSKLDLQISVNSAEKENIAEVDASRNNRAETSCTGKGSLRPASSSKLDGGSVAEKDLDVLENIASDANSTDNAKHKPATTTAKVHLDSDELADKDSSCLGSKLTAVNPKVTEEVSVSRHSPDFVMSVRPKELVFDDGEETNRDRISSPDSKGSQRMSPDKEPLASSEPSKLLDDDTQEVQADSFTESLKIDSTSGRHKAIEVSDLNQPCSESAGKKSQNVQPTKLETRRLSSSPKNSKLDLQISVNSAEKENIAEVDASRNNRAETSCTEKSSLRPASSSNLDGGSVAEKDLDVHESDAKSVTKFNARISVSAPTDEVNIDLAQQAPTDVHNFNSSTESFTNDMEHSCSQYKKRKVEIESEKFLPDSTRLSEKLVHSNNQRPASGTSSIKEDNPEAVIEVQHRAFDQADDIGHERVSKSPTDVMEDTGESQKKEGSSSTVRKEEKLILDGRGRGSDSLMWPEVNPFSFSIESTRSSFDGKEGSQHLQVNSGQNNAENLTCIERTTSSRRIYPEGDTKFLDGLSVYPRFRDSDQIDTGEALPPEFEGFLIPTDNEPCTARDEMEFENIKVPSNSADNSSFDRSSFTCSPYHYSSTPLPYQSLPNGLLEGYGLRTSRPLNDGSPRAFSDCRPKCNGQFTSSVQTLRDRFNSNFGSSGKRKSSKPELPCISEENENVDEITGTFQQGIGPEEMNESITRGQPAEIVENANPSTSVLQGIGPEGMNESITRGLPAEIVENANPSTSVLQDALASEQEDFVVSESNFDGTHNKVKKKLDKQNGNRTRLTSMGKDNKSISLGANGAKRNSESVHKRSSRPKLSGKDSMKLQRPTFSGRKSTRKNNIVSNITSFIPLVQQKQAAAVLPGKKVIQIKALKAAEAAKRNDEMKENERKKKKEVLMELQKKKEERKKEEAKMTAKKRPRENEEKKEKEEKRKRVNDIKQPEHEKILAKKEELKGKEVRESRKIVDGRDDRNKLLPQENKQGIAAKISKTEPLTKESRHGKYESGIECANKGKATIEDNDLIIKNSPLEESYEMSPYKSDDDEDEDDRPSNKFIPSWASKHSLLLAVSSQTMDPEIIFPRQSFCDIAAALLPRKFQS